MIAEADRFVKRKIRKRRQKALTAENYGGTLFHGENMPSNRISPILDGIRQTIAVTVKLQGLFGMLTMPLNSHLDYEQWYPHFILSGFISFASAHMNPFIAPGFDSV